MAGRVPPSREVEDEHARRADGRRECACPGCALNAAVDEAVELWDAESRARFLRIIVEAGERLGLSILGRP
jgi:hypothetical protein